MAFLDRIKRIFAGQLADRLDVSARFQVQKHSATGTMSRFHVVIEIQTDRTLGLKLLDQVKTDHFNSRFKGLNKPSEGEIASKIVHKHVVTTMEYGKTTKQQQFILMEYIDGPGLDTLIKSHHDSMGIHRLRFIRQMANALQAVHEAGFIHRDVCPRNFIADKQVRNLKLIDFGLTVPDEAPYRTPGNRTGTPQYMAPEIVRRRRTDHRVDIFAFGVTMFRMLTFEHPWGSTDVTGIGALAHDSRPPRAILELRPRLNKNLAAAIHRCLEPESKGRPRSFKHFLGLIKSVEQEESE